MNRIPHKTVASILLIAILINSIGCKKNDRRIQHDSGAYSSVSFDIPMKEGYEAVLGSVLNDGENACISIVYTQYNADGIVTDQLTDIVTVDDQGNSCYTLELMGDQVPCAVLENEYVFLGYDKNDVENSGGNLVDLQKTAVFFDKKKGDLIRIIETDFQPYYVSPLSDGFVIVGSSTIARYSREGELIKKLDTGFSCYIDREGFFEDSGKFYVVEEKDLGDLIYHEVNFETGNCPALAASKDIGVVGMNVEGQYFFNPDGEYKVDLINMKVDCIAEWNCIDIRPPKKNLDIPSKQYRMDDERFAISYVYRDHTAEVLLFYYDSSIDRSNVETIKIGGYGVYDDSVLQWAVYSFNTANKDYRVVLEDYGQRFDAYMPEERRKATLALTQYFNEGNTPDIFYGTRFDYAYMGRNGMVIDMSGYMQESSSSMPEMTEAGNRLLFDGSGACYQLFSGYVLYGCKVQESVFNEVPNTSVFSLYQYAQNKDITYSFTGASDIVDTAIRYNFADLWGAYDGKRKITHEELVDLVTIALSIPVSQSGGYASEEDVINGRTLMGTDIKFCEVYNTKDNEEAFEYIGYPSIHGSVHLAVPQCCLAISTTAKNKDKCWEMLSMLLSDEAQKQTMISGYIPVTQEAVDIFCELSMYPEKVTDDVLKSYVGQRKAVDQEVINQFLKTINKADTLATYDWGIFDIINDEINSYYSQNRSPEQIADTLEKRLTLYMQENYQ
ncbi:MAG: hypothetical protein J5767_13190 [Paludibacteraceae bacterium]|nr:hypothetical protein [Paludibacteraceae bacterium]